MSIADLKNIVRDHREQLAATPAQHQALRAIERCRTERAGTHQLFCTNCHHRCIRYNSCRNRHCPCCQQADRARWVAAREQELLPINYFHVVCTMPHELLPLVRLDPRACYQALMQCSRQAIADCCANPRYLGASVGQIQVLHTWGSDLKLHPHVHTIVTGGGFAPDGSWVDAKRNRKKRTAFLVPVGALRKRFRTLMLESLKPLWQQYRNELISALGDAKNYLQTWTALCKQRWVVYAKPPFAHAAIAIRYLGRYTHRVAVHPDRINYQPDGTVHVQYRDYHNGGNQRIKIFSAQQFLHYFVQHIVPKGFRRIRLAGFLAPRIRKESLAKARKLLCKRKPPKPPESSTVKLDSKRTTKHKHQCPHCEHIMLVSEISRPQKDGSIKNFIPQECIAWLKQDVRESANWEQAMIQQT